MQLKFTDCYELDWGNVTPDGYSIEKNEALQVFNVDISSTDKIIRCAVFSVGKVVWLGKHLPDETKQKLVFDLRGQPMRLLESARELKSDIITKVRQLDPNITLIIEILI